MFLSLFIFFTGGGASKTVNVPPSGLTIVVGTFSSPPTLTSSSWVLLPAPGDVVVVVAEKVLVQHPKSSRELQFPSKRQVGSG